MHRTSMTDPLPIATLPLGAGAFGVTLCPGKTGPSQSNPLRPWARDLDDDLDVVAFWGARMVVSLITPEEVERLGLSGADGLPLLARGALVRRMDWIHAPVEARGVPDADVALVLRTEIDRMLPRVRAGARVLFHCNGGLGRSGSVAAFALVRAGVPCDEAVARVRAARGPGAVETPAQEAFVRRAMA